MVTYFISDIHLDENQPDTANLFFKFLAEKACNADALYILGDFFELWIGDDLDSEFITKVKTSLANLADAQVPIYFMHGNRDFLIGEKFATESKCKLISDPSVIELYGSRWLLTHGDLLMDDFYYQCFRALNRNKFIQKCFLLLPLTTRLAIAKNIRKKSKVNFTKLAQTSSKAWDVCPNKVKKFLQKYKVNKLIHGHTHLAKVEKIELGNPEVQAERIVLGSWGKQTTILACSPGSYTLEEI